MSAVGSLRRHRRYEPPPVSASRPRRPYPNGWFAVAFSDEVPPGRVLRRRFMGEDVIVYRTRAGVLRVTSPYCPHLGAHLGYGGFVEGETIVCPFHHFAFDTEGTCVRTGYDTKPPRAQLRQWEVREANGAVFIWRHALGDPPSWELPRVDAAGFPAPVTHCYTIIDHPQEIVENAVDVGHIGPIHGYKDVRVRNPMQTDGHRFTIGPAAQRQFPVLGGVDVIFDAEAHGLGYITVEATIPRFRAAALFQAMATPIDPTRIDLRFVVAIRVGAPGRRGGRAVSRALTVALAQAFWRDLSLDFPIWENKEYLDKPRLAKGDGPIMAFRKWAAQFYSEALDDIAGDDPSSDQERPLEEPHQAHRADPRRDRPGRSDVGERGAVA